MKVDRSGFLIAVAAIAACAAQEPRTITVVAVPVQPPPPDPVPTATATAIATAPAPTHEGAPIIPPAQEGVAPAAEGGGSDEWEPMCRVKNVARPKTCTDDVGTPGDCSKAPCRSTPFICAQCEAYKKSFKPKIAERAVACVVKQSPAQANDGCKTYQCGDEALKTACLDPTTDAPCASIAKTCKTSVDECKGLLSGMNAAGRASVIACAKKCPYGLWSCVEGL